MNFRVVLVIVCASFVVTTLLDTSYHIRKRRWLVWRDQGSSFMQFIAGLGIPIEVRQQAVTLGLVLKAFYSMPTNSSVFTRPSIDYTRKKRGISRWMLYANLEKLIDSYKFGEGKACLLRSICEAAHTPLDDRSGVLSEIVSAVLKPSSTKEEFEHHLNADYVSAEEHGKNHRYIGLVTSSIVTANYMHTQQRQCKENFLRQLQIATLWSLDDRWRNIS